MTFFETIAGCLFYKSFPVWVWRKKGINYGVKLLPRGFWYDWWTPRFHEGRGPYITASLYVIAIFRGY
jgi:hypothetical protein